MRWNSPPIKTGISRVHCGNQPSVGKQRVCPSLLPSPTLSLILTRSCSSSCLPPLPFSPFTVTIFLLFSHPIFCLSSTYFFFNLVVYIFTVNSLNPNFQKYFFIVSLLNLLSHLYNYAHCPPLCFILFIIFFFLACSHPESP